MVEWNRTTSNTSNVGTEVNVASALVAPFQRDSVRMTDTRTEGETTWQKVCTK